MSKDLSTVKVLLEELEAKRSPKSWETEKHNMEFLHALIEEYEDTTKYQAEKLRIAVEALEQLLEAHKLLFRSSLFSAFTAGKSNFSRAWKQAEEALAKIRGEK